MDSLNVHKGYNKVTNNTQPPPPPRLITITLTVILTVVILSFLISLIHDTLTKSHEDKLDSISAVCSVTRYPSTCLDSVRNLSVSRPDPELIFNVTLQVSLAELKNIATQIKSLVAKSNDKGTESALRDCGDLFDDAVSQLTESTHAVDGGLKGSKVGDLNTWISAAMTDQETCVDGLEEMGSTLVDEVKTKVQRSKEYLSNSLAILANMNSLLEKFHLDAIH